MADVGKHITVSEVRARKNFPRGVPNGVDPESRLYSLPVVINAAGRVWSELLVASELEDAAGPERVVVTHVYLSQNGFDLEHHGPEVYQDRSVTAKYRQAVVAWMRKNGFEVSFA